MSVSDIPAAKICPACGCEAELHIKRVRGSNMYWIECGGCFLMTARYWTEQEAVNEWNGIEVEKDDEEETSEVEVLKAQIDLLKREIEVAIEDLKDVIETADGVNYCQYCKHNNDDGQCHHPCNPYAGESGWEWRGVPQEAGND